MTNINDGITFKKWHKVIEKIEQFNSDGLVQLNTKDKAIVYAVNQIRKVFAEYKIEIAFFHNRFAKLHLHHRLGVLKKLH